MEQGNRYKHSPQHRKKVSAWMDACRMRSRQGKARRQIQRPGSLNSSYKCKALNISNKYGTPFITASFCHKPCSSAPIQATHSGHWTRLKVSGWMGHLRSYLIDRRLSSVDLITIPNLFENTSVLNRNEVFI